MFYRYTSHDVKVINYDICQGQPVLQKTNISTTHEDLGSRILLWHNSWPQQPKLGVAEPVNVDLDVPDHSELMQNYSSMKLVYIINPYEAGIINAAWQAHMDYLLLG